jgi:hypothetical protein
MVNQFSNGGQAGHGQAALQAPPDFFQFLFGRSALLALAAWTLLCFLLLRGWDDVRPRRKGAGIPPGLPLAAWAVGPFVVSYAVSQTSAGILTEENLPVSLPAAYLLLARADTRAFSGRAAGVFQATVAAGLAAVSLAYLLFSMDYYTPLPKNRSARPPPTWPPTEMTAPSSSAATPTTGSTTIWLPETASRLARPRTLRK